jgi:hypothetical protein
MGESHPMSGPIDPKFFPFLLNDLHRQGATGSLKVEGDNHQKALYFRSGRILFGSSNDPKDQLGAILIESGKITEEQLEDVNKKVGPGNPLAKALADSGIVSQRELSDAARAKVERILSDVLSYTAGSYEFEDGVLPKGAVDLKLAPERLFMAAVRRIGDRGFVLRHLESLGMIVAAKPELQEKLPEIEGELLGVNQHLDGLTSVKDAAGRAAIDEFDAAKIVCGLLFLGLAEKSSAATVIDSSDSPFFVPAEGGAELDFGQGSAAGGDQPEPTMPFGATDLPQPEPSLAAGSAPRDADSTVMLGDLPNFSLPSLSTPPAPEPPPFIPAPPPPPPPVVAGGPAPLKIIAPPRPAERTRPPSKPSKEDLAALDELLGKRSPEGPLTPIQKPAEEWKPTFLPAQPARGKKQKTSSGRNMVLFGTVGVLVVAAAGGGWVAWSSNRPPVTTAANPPRPAPSMSPATPTAAPSAAASVAASPAAVASPTPSAAASVVPATRPSVPAASTPPTATAPSARPSAAATTAPPKAGATPSMAESGALLRRGQFDLAANGFLAHFKASKGSYSIQLLVACSTETIQKAAGAVTGDELYVLPVQYKGKDCHRLCWGLYDNEAKANAGLRGVPGYFKQGGARPKVMSVAELLR